MPLQDNRRRDERQQPSYPNTGGGGSGATGGTGGGNIPLPEDEPDIPGYPDNIGGGGGGLGFTQPDPSQANVTGGMTQAGDTQGEFQGYILPIAAGGFLYIAAADLVPELHKETKTSKTIMAFSMFLVGVALMWLVKFAFHGGH